MNTASFLISPRKVLWRGALAERLRTQTRRQQGDARLVGNLCRAVGLVAGRCVLWLARIRRQAHRRILLRPSGQLPHGCEPRLWPRTVPAENALYSEPANFQRGEVEVDGRNL